jgi:hypothetical protein
VAEEVFQTQLLVQQYTMQVVAAVGLSQPNRLEGAALAAVEPVEIKILHQVMVLPILEAAAVEQVTTQAKMAERADLVL